MVKERLRERRELLGIFQRELAGAVGVSAATIMRWEGGGSYPDARQLAAICGYLHVSADYLLGLVDENAITYSLLPREKQYLLDAFYKFLQKREVEDD